MTALLALSAILLAGAAGGTPEPAAGWQWPLLPRPAVVHPFDAPAGPYAAGHRGVDLAGAVGDPVRAAGAGVVAFAGRVAGRGVVSVDHAGGVRTTYEPVAPAVSRGDPVAAGDVLGRLEAAGGHCLAVACLHWGARRAASYLDPLTLLGRPRVRLLPVWSAGGHPAATPDPPVRSPAASDPGRASAALRRLDPAPASARGAPAGPATVLLAALVAAAVLRLLVRGPRRWARRRAGAR